MTISSRYAGVDVSKHRLDAAFAPAGEHISLPAQDAAKMAAWLKARATDLVVIEATGGYEQQAFAQLCEHGLSVAIVNPRAVRQFAQAMGLLEKTDKIDAGVIAWYAETRKCQPLCLAPQTQLELRARVTRLRQLTEVRTAQKNQQRLVTNHAVREGFGKMLAFLAEQIAELEQAIYQWLTQWNTDPKAFVWTATADIILDKVRRCKELAGTAH